jgi:hypothetical protein
MVAVTALVFFWRGISVLVTGVRFLPTTWYVACRWRFTHDRRHANEIIAMPDIPWFV